MGIKSIISIYLISPIQTHRNDTQKFKVWWHSVVRIANRMMTMPKLHLFLHSLSLVFLSGALENLLESLIKLSFYRRRIMV
jgi:hypothetical protein